MALFIIYWLTVFLCVNLFIIRDEDQLTAWREKMEQVKKDNDPVLVDVFVVVTGPTINGEFS